MKTIKGEYSHDAFEVKENKSAMIWELIYKKTGKTAGVFEVVEDDEGYWLKTIVIRDDFGRRGLGTWLVKLAVERLSFIYIYYRENREDYMGTPSGDGRYLTEEGHMFVKKLVERKIIPVKWLRIPDFKNYGGPPQY